MKRTISTLLAIALMTASTLVNAGQFGVTAEIGYCISPMPKDGLYYQEQLDHDSQMGSQYLSIGAEYRTDRYNLIASYDVLGQRQIWSYGYPDNDYSRLEDDGVMPGESPCGGCYGYFYTRERIEGFRLAVSTPSSMKLYAEAGLWLMKNNTVMTLIQITEDHNEVRLKSDREIEVHPEVAIGYRFNENAAVIGRYYHTEDNTGGIPNMSDAVFTLGLKVSF